MQRSEIIELAYQLTERKTERQISNVNSLYSIVLQDICKRQRFWWRRLAVNFTLSAGVQKYDLTTITTSPALTEILFEEISKFQIILSTTPYQVQDLLPVYDPTAIIAMLDGAGNNAQPATPARYTMNPFDYKTLLIDAPDLNYTAYLVGWAMPNPASDSTNDNVPLIPPYGHNAIVAGLVAKMFRFAYGSQNPKSQDAALEYEQAIQDLEAKRQFDPNYQVQMNLQESAVRST